MWEITQKNPPCTLKQSKFLNIQNNQNSALSAQNYEYNSENYVEIIININTKAVIEDTKD